jgi:protein-tyrosine phosphatase
LFKLFSKKDPTAPAFRLLKADMHSHLIPGIDDGSPDMETSLELIRGMISLGYTKLITTPHILWDMYKNSTEVIFKGIESLKAAVNEVGLEVELHAAAEYFLDDHVAELLRSKAKLLTIKDNMVLVEFSMAYHSHSLKDILFEMQMQGYLPVIAHPERYIYLQKNKEFFEELKDLGCLFQMNVLSLTPHYGKSVQDLASYLIKKEYYDLIGSDLHHKGHIEAMKNPALVSPLERLIASGKIRNAELA